METTLKTCSVCDRPSSSLYETDSLTGKWGRYCPDCRVLEEKRKILRDKAKSRRLAAV